MSNPTAPPPNDINPPQYLNNQNPNMSGYQPMNQQQAYHIPQQTSTQPTNTQIPPNQQQAYTQPQGNTQMYPPPVYQQTNEQQIPQQQQQQQQTPQYTTGQQGDAKAFHPQPNGYTPEGYPLYPQVQPSTATVQNPYAQNQQVQQPQYQQQPQQPYPQQQYVQQQPYVQQVTVSSNSLYNPKSAVPGANTQTHVVVQKKKEGMFSSITKSLETGLNSISHEVDKALGNSITTDREADGRFRRHFSLPPFEGLFLEVPAKAATIDTVLYGHLYLSYSYLSYYCELQGKRATVMIPLRDIIQINRAMIGRTAKESHPNIIPYNPNDCKLADHYVIEVYTNVGKVHQFFSVPNFERTFQNIETAWRNCNKSVIPPQPQVIMYPNSGQPQYTNQTPIQFQQQAQQPVTVQQQQNYVQPQYQPHVYTTTTTTTYTTNNKPVVVNPPVLYPNSKK